AGSEECGLIGLTSQILLALGLQAANLAITQQNWLYAGVAIALAPLAGYRFGVSGSREYVKTLSPDELRRIRGVVSVDSVGEGRLYIPRSEEHTSELQSQSNLVCRLLLEKKKKKKKKKKKNLTHQQKQRKCQYCDHR